MSPLCDMTVTVYRGKKRLVAENCFYSGRYTGREDIRGMGLQGKFTLIAPADHPIHIGDRVMPGIGPEERPGDAPAVTWVQPMYLGGSIHHYEAGNG